MNEINYCKDGAMYGKIFKDFHYYNKLWKSLSRIYPLSKYKEELAQISVSLQKLYEKVTSKPRKSCKESDFNTEQEETKFG